MSDEKGNATPGKGGVNKGAVMLAASSVDAMLKYKGYTEGTLNARMFRPQGTCKWIQSQK